jgi:hypothetical protein
MSSAELFNEDDRRDFLELTSDSAIRTAAYPEDEWIKNGGTITLLGHPVPYQDDPPVINTGMFRLSDLLGGPVSVKQDLDSRAANIHAHWSIVQSHPFYRWLKGKPSFVIAKNTFDNKRKRVTSGKLCSEFADFRFVRLIALHMGWCLLAESIGYRPRYADRKLLNQAKGHIEKLRGCILEGVRLSDYQSQNCLAKSHARHIPYVNSYVLATQFRTQCSEFNWKLLVLNA